MLYKIAKKLTVYKLWITGVCEYKGLQYTTGQKFDDGCQYKCECLDGMTGAYKCTERYY